MRNMKAMLYGLPVRPGLWPAAMALWPGDERDVTTAAITTARGRVRVAYYDGAGRALGCVDVPAAYLAARGHVLADGVRCETRRDQ